MTRITRGPSHPAPSGGRPEPTNVTWDGRRVINIDTYIPYFLAAVNNAVSRSASQRYLTEFGVGVTEWRVLSWLATERDIPASRICEVIALDKAAVSRSVGKLEEMGMLVATPAKTDPRRKTLALTEAGYRLHDRILAIALEREARLVDGADPDDLEAFLRVMRVLRRNVDHL